MLCQHPKNLYPEWLVILVSGFWHEATQNGPNLGCDFFVSLFSCLQLRRIFNLRAKPNQNNFRLLNIRFPKFTWISSTAQGCRQPCPLHTPVWTHGFQGSSRKWHIKQIPRRSFRLGTKPCSQVTAAHQDTAVPKLCTAKLAPSEPN